MASTVPRGGEQAPAPPAPLGGRLTPQRGERAPDWPWALLLTVLGALLRCYKLGANSLWVDEFATLKIVTLPFPEIMRAAAEVNFCPPLYFWLVHGVASVFGTSEASLRLVSLVAGSLTVPVVWLLTRELTESRSGARLSTALFAVNPLHLWYSQEARPYALLVLLATTGLLLLVLAMRTGKITYWGGFVVAATGTILTHTIGPVFIAPAWLWAVWSRRRATPLRPLLLASAGIGLLSAPFALVVGHAVASATGSHSPARPLTGLELPYTLLTYVVGYSFGPSTREIQNLGPAMALQAHPLEALLAGATLAMALVLIVLRPPHGWKFLWLLCLVPIAAMLLGSASSGKAYQARYALSGLVGFCGLFGGALSRLSRRLRLPLAASVLTLSAWADGQWYYASRYWKDDSRAVIAWLAKALPTGATVVTAPNYVAGVLSYYATLQHAPIHVEGVDSVAWSRAHPAALMLTRLHHVDDPERLRSRFRAMAGSRVREDTVGGYEILRGTDGSQTHSK